MSEDGFMRRVDRVELRERVPAETTSENRSLGLMIIVKRVSGQVNCGRC